MEPMNLNRNQLDHGRFASTNCNLPRGFTIAEVLIVTAITAILISICLPAVEQSREAARRMHCLSRLKDLGVACEAYLGARRKYPRYPDDLHRPGVSGHVELLPYLGLTSLKDRIPDNEFIITGEEPPAVSHTSGLMNLGVGAFRCPSDAALPIGGNSYRGCAGTSPGLHTRVDLNWPNEPKKWSGFMAGIFRGTPSPQNVRDGLSNTVLFSERIAGDMNPKHVNPWRDVYLYALGETEKVYSPDNIYNLCRNLEIASGHYSWAGSSWLAGGFHHATYNHILPPNSTISDCASSGGLSYYGAMTARSMHGGGVNVCFADGHCQFISDNVDLAVWRALATRDGREIVSAADF